MNCIRISSYLRGRSKCSTLKKFHPFPLSNFRNIHTPFQDDLTPLDEDLFSIAGFQDYKEAPDVKAHREKLGIPPFDCQINTKKTSSKSLSSSTNSSLRNSDSQTNLETQSFELEKSTPSIISNDLTEFSSVCEVREPAIFISRLSDPYLNLALEDYIYNKMPLQDAPVTNFNRLMFYVNSPCVVIGKNQNPWSEVNLQLLQNLRLPLVRRRSGGGTVVHDSGNVNYSFMTSKEKFDRFTFAELVSKAVNSAALSSKPITVNQRGDIVTQEDSYKVSGSAYKLSKGKSYHHGTMLLNLKLDVLRQLLHRDPSISGEIVSNSAVPSVPSKVTNLHIENDDFIQCVSDEFMQTFGSVFERSSDISQDEFDQTELLGLYGFVQAFSLRTCLSYTIDETCNLPDEVYKVAEELKSWAWKFGATPKFQHTFHHDKLDLTVQFEIAKGGTVESVKVDGDLEQIGSFEFLNMVISRGDKIEYTGGNIAGLVLDDELSEWIGNSIDGSS